METNKLTKKEINSIVEIQNRINTVKQEFGNIAFVRLDLNKREQEVQAIYQNLRKQESELAQELETKYGQGSIDIDNGVFIPTQKTQQPKAVPTVE